MNVSYLASSIFHIGFNMSSKIEGPIDLIIVFRKLPIILFEPKTLPIREDFSAMYFFVHICFV